jgi:RHS repeat-associated protein
VQYVGNKVYENNQLDKILLPNGYIQNNIYYFYLRDHLGNNSVVARGSDGAIMQGQHYYPYGKVNEYEGTGSPSFQPYKFGGKEEESMHGLGLLDFHARQLNNRDVPYPLTMDPLCEKYYSWSPYSWCAGNPVRNVDPTGMIWKETKDEEYASSLSEAMQKRMNGIEKDISKKYDSYKKEALKGNTGKANEIMANMLEMGKDYANMEKGIAELAAMGETKDQVFTYDFNIEGDIGGAKTKDGVIVMSIVGKGDMANGVHESSHGYDIWKAGRMPQANEVYDAEIKANGRQISYGGASVMPFSYWGKVETLRDITIPWIMGILDAKGDYLYPKKIGGERYYNKAETTKYLNNLRKK